MGKRAEQKIRQWLDRPQDGYCLDRIPDQLGGYYGAANIADFTCFKSPDLWYIESKETERDAFPFSRITQIQYNGLLAKSKIEHVHGIVIVLFSRYRRAFIFDISDIDAYRRDAGHQSVNIGKIGKWGIPYAEIPTIESRKIIPDYSGDLAELFSGIGNEN